MMSALLLTETPATATILLPAGTPASAAGPPAPVHAHTEGVSERQGGGESGIDRERREGEEGGREGGGREGGRVPVMTPSSSVENPNPLGPF